MNLLVLTQNNCRYCNQAKEYLNNQDVEYDVVNISELPEKEQKEIQDKYDMMGAPTILLLDEDEVIAKTTGFNQGILDSLIEQL